MPEYLVRKVEGGTETWVPLLQALDELGIYRRAPLEPPDRFGRQVLWDIDDGGRLTVRAELAEAEREAADLESDPPPVNLDYVPDWIDTGQPRQWGRLYFDARENLGFKNDFHVQSALAKVYGLDKWDEREQSPAARSYRESWHLLQEHQRSKEGQ